MEEEKEEKKELVISINITLANLMQSHKALFESYSRFPNPNNESALFFFQTIIEELSEDKKTKELVDKEYTLSEKDLKEYYKNAN